MIITALDVTLWIIYFISLYYVVFWLLIYLEKTDIKSNSAEDDGKLPFVTIAIPAYNESSKIIPTIASAAALKYPEDKFEIIVMNDGSKDDTAVKAAEYIRTSNHKNIRLISQKNKGKGAALNNALANSSSELFVVFDADSYIGEDALRRMVPHMEDKTVGAVLPAMRARNPKNMLQKLQTYEYMVSNFYKTIMTPVNCMHVCPGPFSMFRREVIEKIGGFDEHNNLTEDLEITLRVQKTHHRIVQLEDVYVDTIVPENIRELLKQRNRWYKGTVQNLVKHRDLILNSKYGDFGMMQMPMVLMSGILAISVAFIFFYTLLKPLFSDIKKLFLVHFDIFTLLRDMQFNFSVWDVSFGQMLISFTLLVIGLYMLIKSFKMMKHKTWEYGPVSIVVFVFLYFFLMGVAWFQVAVDLVRGKRQIW